MWISGCIFCFNTFLYTGTVVSIKLQDGHRNISQELEVKNFLYLTRKYGFLYILIFNLWVGYGNQLPSIILICFWPTNVGPLDESPTYLHCLTVSTILWISFLCKFKLYYIGLENCGLLTRIWKWNAMGAVSNYYLKYCPELLIHLLPEFWLFRKLLIPVEQYFPGK